MAAAVQIKGLDKLLQLLDNLEEAVVVDVDSACLAAAYDINADAATIIQGARVDTGELLKSQQVIEDPQTRTYTVFNSAPYAGWVHFGTGAKVSIPKEWEDIAKEWKGKKGGTFAEFVQRMREWCSRHGIPPEKAYIICVTILTNGLDAVPFLAAPFEKHSPRLVKEVTDIIKHAIRP